MQRGDFFFIWIAGALTKLQFSLVRTWAREAVEEMSHTLACRNCFLESLLRSTRPWQSRITATMPHSSVPYSGSLPSAYISACLPLLVNSASHDTYCHCAQSST